MSTADAVNKLARGLILAKIRVDGQDLAASSAIGAAAIPEMIGDVVPACMVCIVVLPCGIHVALPTPGVVLMPAAKSADTFSGLKRLGADRASVVRAIVYHWDQWNVARLG